MINNRLRARFVRKSRASCDLQPADPAARAKGVKIDSSYSPTVGLSKQEANHVLDCIDRTTLLGLRDFALLTLAIRTGLRRGEIRSLAVGSIGDRDGDKVLTVIGKSNKRSFVKLLVYA